MKRVVLVSDNHGNEMILKHIRMMNNADYFVHCGDSEMSHNDLKGFVTVKGNCDHDRDFLLVRILTIEGHNILITHGHKYIGFSYELKDLIAIAKDYQCDMVFFGHIHIFIDETIDGIRLINPGSLKYNRDYTNPCYAVVDIEKDKVNVKRIDVQ